MISSLRGVLLDKNLPALTIEVNGVGYELEASVSTFADLPSQGDTVFLLTHFVVREDAQQLYGFSTAAERRLFRALIKVNGVGPKLALSILSGIDGQSFAQYVAAKDVKALTRLPGVGKKTAERLIVEMQDRLSEWESGERAAVNTAAASSAPVLADAETALLALGYKPAEASKVLAGIDTGDFDSTEDIIREALKRMVRR